MRCVTASPRPSPSMAFTRAGKAWCEKGGATIRKAVIRTVASSRTSSQVGSMGMPTSRASEQGRYLREEVVGERDHLRNHPVSADDQGHGHGGCLRHEGQGGFLQLCDGLQQ